MTQTKLTALLRQWQLGQSAKGLCLNRNGHWIAAAIAGGQVALAFSEDAGEEPQIVDFDGSEIISLIPDCDDHAYLVLTESGKIYITEPQVQVPTPIVEKENILCVVSSCAGHRAFAIDNKIYFLDEFGAETKDTFTAPATINDLQFNDDGTLLAASHSGGVTIFDFDGTVHELAMSAAPIKIDWCDEKIAAVLADHSIALWESFEQDFRIYKNDNFQTTPCLCGLTAEETHLAVAGARQAMLLPFKEGETQRLLGGVDRRTVTYIAPHPSEPFIMIGYDDGLVVMAPLDGRVHIMIHPPTAPTGAGVTGLQWNPRGDCLMVTLESGWLMLFTETSIQKAVRARL